jgi:hypothetical protein
MEEKRREGRRGGQSRKGRKRGKLRKKGGEE